MLSRQLSLLRPRYYFHNDNSNNDNSNNNNNNTDDDNNSYTSVIRSANWRLTCLVCSTLNMQCLMLWLFQLVAAAALITSFARANSWRSSEEAFCAWATRRDYIFQEFDDGFVVVASSASLEASFVCLILNWAICRASILVFLCLSVSLSLSLPLSESSDKQLLFTSATSLFFTHHFE